MSYSLSNEAVFIKLISQRRRRSVRTSARHCKRLLHDLEHAYYLSYKIEDQHSHYLRAHDIPCSLQYPRAVDGRRLIQLLVTDMKKGLEENKYGKVYSAFLRAPVYMNSEYGGFFFYAQHLVQMATTLFGCFPKTVKAYQNGDSYICVLRYEDKDIVLNFIEGNNVYYASVSAEKGVFEESGKASDALYAIEFMEYYKVLSGGEQELTYEEFFAPVYIMNAIVRSLESGKEEEITYA